MKIAVISFNHPESTIVLAKYLALNHEVDYYFITSLKSIGVPAFEFRTATKKLGIVKLDETMSPEVFSYMGSANIKLNLIRLIQPFMKLLTFNDFVIRRVCSKVLKENYDAINIIGQHDILLTFYKYLASFKNITHTLHEVNVHYSGQSIGNRLIAFLLNNNLKIIVHSDVALMRIKQNPMFGKSIVKKINFGLFESYLFYDKEENVRTSNNILLFYGFIRPYKGLDVLYYALEIIKNQIKDFKVIIAGEGNDPFLDKLKANPYCTVLNKHLSNEEIVSLNKQAKVVVCPYKSASQSGIILTTFLFKKPVIASNVGGFSEIIKNNVNGLLVSPSDPKELSSAILNVFTSIKLYKSLSNGVNSFGNEPGYDWRNIANMTFQFLEM